MYMSTLSLMYYSFYSSCTFSIYYQTNVKFTGKVECCYPSCIWLVCFIVLLLLMYCNDISYWRKLMLFDSIEKQGNGGRSWSLSFIFLALFFQQIKLAGFFCKRWYEVYTVERYNFTDNFQVIYHSWFFVFTLHL